MNVKQSILSALEQNRGTALSGQALAEQLGVTRNAVWKAIHTLQAEGYAVLATPNRGYRLADDCDRLSAAGLAARLLAAVRRCWRTRWRFGGVGLLNALINFPAE